jgi:hypothetical protein
VKFILRWTENGGQDKREQTEECVYLPIPGDLYTPANGPQLRIEWRRLGGDAIPILGGVVALSEEDL